MAARGSGNCTRKRSPSEGGVGWLLAPTPAHPREGGDPGVFATGSRFVCVWTNESPSAPSSPRRNPRLIRRAPAEHLASLAILAVKNLGPRLRGDERFKR